MATRRPSSQGPAGNARDADDATVDPMADPVGAQDDLDVALLRLHRLTLAATVRAGSRSTPSLTATQVRVLSLLAAGPGGMSLSAIATALAMSPPSASRLCQRLVRDGLVVREAGPGHYIMMSLSQEGEQLLGEVNRARVDPLRQLIESLPERRRRAMFAALRDLGELARSGHEQHGLW